AFPRNVPERYFDTLQGAHHGLRLAAREHAPFAGPPPGAAAVAALAAGARQPAGVRRRGVLRAGPRRRRVLRRNLPRLLPGALSAGPAGPRLPPAQGPPLAPAAPPARLGRPDAAGPHARPGRRRGTGRGAGDRLTTRGARSRPGDEPR